MRLFDYDLRPQLAGTYGFQRQRSRSMRTVGGAHASARIHSLAETAKANGPEPSLWLRHLLRYLPTAPNAKHFEALLHWNCQAADLITT